MGADEIEARMKLGLKLHRGKQKGAGKKKDPCPGLNTKIHAKALPQSMASPMKKASPMEAKVSTPMKAKVTPMKAKMSTPMEAQVTSMKANVSKPSGMVAQSTKKNGNCHIRRQT